MVDSSVFVYNIVKYGILAGLVVGFGILIIGSILVHDTWYIMKNPKFFATETIAMGLSASLPVGLICYFRGVALHASLIDAVIMFLKVSLIHVGFQLSGIYSVLFPTSSNLEKKLKEES
jgi:hypothetical protein